MKSPFSQLARRTEPPPISWLMHLALSRPKLISLAAGFTDHETLPVRDVRELIEELLRSERKGRPVLQYGSTEGDPVLRELTARRIQHLDRAADSSREYSTDRTLIANGSQQLLYMITEALCDPGDLVLVEDPTYFVFLGILQSRGVRSRTVRMDADGLDLEHLAFVLESLRKSGELTRLKAFYLVSYFQNPTGITTAFRKKSGILRLLGQFERSAGHPIYLLEDAAYRELRFHGGDVTSALATDGHRDRVIYCGTYSKPFATGVRVGFGVLPEPLYRAVLRIKGNHDFGTSNLLQHLLARAITSGRYERHLGELRRKYARKARVMLQALKDHFPQEVGWREPEGGMYFWAWLPPNMKSGIRSSLFKAALAGDVLYVPGELCYADDPTRRKPNRELRLSFGSAPERDIREGIARLGRVLKQLHSTP